MTYEQMFHPASVLFYDMDDKEIEIPERALKEAYTEIDQAIYEWEQYDY